MDVFKLPRDETGTALTAQQETFITKVNGEWGIWRFDNGFVTTGEVVTF